LIIDTDEEASGLVSQLIIGVTDAIENTQYNLVVTPHSRNKNDPMETIRSIVETRAADGVIISGIAADDRRLLYLNEVGFPFVTHGRSDMGISHAYFDFDNTKFGLNAVQLLAGLNRRRAAMIFPPPLQTYGRHMLDGFQSGLQETGLEGYQIPNVTIENSIEEIAENVALALEMENRPDGIIAGSVPSTVGVVNGIELAGYVVGRDIDVVGKQSTTDFLRWLGRPLYSQTIDYPAEWGKMT